MGMISGQIVIATGRTVLLYSSTKTKTIVSRGRTCQIMKHLKQRIDHDSNVFVEFDV